MLDACVRMYCTWSSKQHSLNEFAPVLAKEAYEGVEVQLHLFLTWALRGGEWSVRRRDRFIFGERSLGLYWI